MVAGDLRAEEGQVAMTRMTLLVNPAAAGGRAAGAARRAAARLRAGGVAVTEIAGRSAAEAAELARAAVDGGTEALVACGGDGIAHLAVQAVVGSTTVLGVIPAGTGNDLARTIGLPLAPPETAAEVVLAGLTRRIDLGRIGEVHYGTVLAAGFDSRVNDRVNRMRWPTGRTRYNLAMVTEFAAFSPIPFVLGVDGAEHELEAMLVAVGNGTSYGGGMRICPDAQLDDGLLDVTVISRISRAKLIRLFPTVYPGRHVDRPEVLTFRAAEVTLSAPGVTGYADGELISALPVTCTAVPQALTVFAP